MAKAEPDDAIADQIEVGIRQVIASAVLFNYEVAERTGMNIRDAQVLGLCQLHGPLTAGQIATLAQLPSATVTGVIDRLEALHMVRRGRDAKDRRKVIVEVDDEHLFRTLGPYYVEQSTRLREVLATYSAAAAAGDPGLPARHHRRPAGPGAPAPLSWRGTPMCVVGVTPVAGAARPTPVDILAVTTRGGAPWGGCCTRTG